MSDKLPEGGFVLIEQLPPEKCQLCGKVEELRPYGVGGTWVCFDCGMADKKTTETMFCERLAKGGAL